MLSHAFVVFSCFPVIIMVALFSSSWNPILMLTCLFLFFVFSAFLSYHVSDEVPTSGDYFYVVLVFCVFIVVSCVLGCVEGAVVFCCVHFLSL